MSVDDNLYHNLELQLCWIRRHARLKEGFAQPKYGQFALAHLTCLSCCPVRNTSVCIAALNPIEQFFSHVGTFSSLPGLNQYEIEDKVCVNHGHNPYQCLR